jgi:MoaA/NifB/PqqE/SkfB family radical SAM enzyme
MPFLKIEELKTLIIDFTSHCNAMCGNCSRNISGVDVNPNMPLDHMSLRTWKKIIDNSTYVDEIIFNGSYGDAIMNPNLLEALEYASSKKISIMIHTNGGIGKPELYVKLANVLKKFKQPSGITWSIDGLEDTNHLYRRGVIWQRIIDNAQAFINAGGLARWRMLVFDHNAHQLKECEQLAFSMGFKKFDINGGHTFSAINSIVGKAVEKFKANKKEEARTIAYNKSYLDNVERVKGLLEKGFDKSQITCKWQKKRKVQISHIGEVLPCCYLLTDRYPRYPDSPYAIEQKDIKWPNINTESLKDIVQGETLTYPKDNRFKICEVTCGEV